MKDSGGFWNKSGLGAVGSDKNSHFWRMEMRWRLTAQFKLGLSHQWIEREISYRFPADRLDQNSSADWFNKWSLIDC